ncbi:FdhD protein [Mucilaginibacter sp. SG538B]|uniref:formate dehydrogenase accessory sulfurtransferase FdhD n=1 Tax=Mucilaginibacter sp. SG538B TaxID=2587021 RepID=UPI0018072468|nr:formate dehydrogenase accessory sulfurtransferase FdhD [Mucilaginibacter sp. SG538B]NVM66738.1 FdhD protein [Mucilaginibacter sp. SG538B]
MENDIAGCESPFPELSFTKPANFFDINQCFVSKTILLLCSLFVMDNHDWQLIYCRQMIPARNLSIMPLEVIRMTRNEVNPLADFLAVEEPLEIRLAFNQREERVIRNISVTMRTPGNDTELALGFLFTEGIIRAASDIRSVELRGFACAENKENTIQVNLQESITPNISQADRNFYTTSSCGVCGKGSIAAIRTVSVFEPSAEDEYVCWSLDTLMELPSRLRRQQEIFQETGGLHACALFDDSGELILLKEDVGRHNALDKLIGTALQMNLLPLKRYGLLLSGRASFELIQKAAMGGVTIVAAIGAPSSLAVTLAEEFNITLIGFLKNDRFNIYTHQKRINFSIYENQD